jgi:hypothetical protein
MADEELDALNALEKEASEFNKVCGAFVSLLLSGAFHCRCLRSGCRDRTDQKGLSIRCVSILLYFFSDTTEAT